MASSKNLCMYLQSILTNYNCARKLPLISVQNNDTLRFLGYVLKFASFENSEINNRFKYLSGGR